MDEVYFELVENKRSLLKIIKEIMKIKLNQSHIKERQNDLVIKQSWAKPHSSGRYEGGSQQKGFMKPGPEGFVCFGQAYGISCLKPKGPHYQRPT